MEISEQTGVALVARARKLGASDCEVLLETSSGIDSSILDHGVEHSELSERRLSMRLWLKSGASSQISLSTLEMSDREIGALIARAEMSSSEVNDRPVVGVIGRARGLGLLDKRYAHLELSDRLDVVMEMFEGATRQATVGQVGRFYYQDRLFNRVFSSSKGASASEQSTLYKVWGSVSISIDNRTITVSNEASSRGFASIASIPIGVIAARRADALFGESVSLTGAVRTMLPPHVTAGLFARLARGFAENDRAHTFLGKSSPWDERLHLVDDGRLSGGIRSAAFDDRGVGPVPISLIKDGRVNAEFISIKEARRRGVRPTGHQVERWLFPRNLVLRPGSRSINAILSDRSERVFVVDHFESYDDLDLQTGVLKVVASGQLFDGNVAIGVVHRVSLVASLDEVFSGLIELASNSDRHGHVDACAMLVDGFVVQGDRP